LGGKTGQRGSVFLPSSLSPADPFVCVACGEPDAETQLTTNPVKELKKKD